MDSCLAFFSRNSAAIGRSLLVFFYYVVGIAYYHREEGWDTTDCIYFITVSVTTVGYGSFVPTTDHARIFTVFYVLFGLAFVLTAALAVAKWLIVTVQKRLLQRLNASDNIVLKEMNKIGLCVVFLAIAVLMGTWFFAVNEKWTAAESFYWTIMTMTTVGYGDFHIKHRSTRQFAIFFIVYCVLVFAIAIQNINESYSEVKAYRGRIKIALLQPKSAVFTPGHETTGATIADDVDTIDDSHLRTRITTNGSDGSYMREVKNLFCLPSMGNTREAVGDGAVGQKMDCNEFVIEALLRCHAINYDTDLEPILNHLRDMNLGEDGLIDREEISKYFNSRSRSRSLEIGTGTGVSPLGGTSRNPMYEYGEIRPKRDKAKEDGKDVELDEGIGREEAGI